jgi:endonuclease/exonuclease/phosphatase (EEP) superfamily protein YafD
MAAELVVVSWNLQGRDPARVRLAQAVSAWKADVLLFQEADGERVRDALPDYPTCLWWTDAGTRPGMAIVARWPHAEAGAMPLADSGRARAAWARLLLDDGPITVLDVHITAPPWPGTPARRRAQRAAAADWAGQRVAAGERIVVGGDFNTLEPSLDGLTPLSDVRRPSWRPLTVPWMRPVLRIDALFGGGVELVSAGVDDRWRGSDHCPVVVRIGV